MDKFNIGDWVFCEYKLQQISAMQHTNTITGVSDGMFSMSSNNLNDRCFALTLRGNAISQRFAAINQELHRLPGNLNHPDFHRYLVGLWSEAMRAQDEPESARKYLDEAEIFLKEARSIASGNHQISIAGMKFYRQ